MQEKDTKNAGAVQPTKNVQKNNDVIQRYAELFASMAQSVSNHEECRYMFNRLLKQANGGKYQVIETTEKAKAETATNERRMMPKEILYRLFGEYAEEQLRENLASALEYEGDTPELLQESNEMYFNSYKDNRADLENGTTERLLKHLGIIKGNAVDLDSLETAIKTLRLLFNFCENHEDRIFLLPGLEIWPKQLNKLHHIIRGL